MGHRVVVPLRVLRGPALGGDDRVLAPVLHPHHGELADLAAPVPAHGDDDHRQAGGVLDVATLAAGGLVLGDLIADPRGGAGLVLTFDCHETSVGCRPPCVGGHWGSRAVTGSRGRASCGGLLSGGGHWPTRRPGYSLPSSV